MRFTIHTDMPHVGFALNSARAGDNAEVDAARFMTSDDGNLLVSRLSAIANTLFAGRNIGVRESQIENFLAIYHPDLRIEVIVNELSFLSKVRPKRSVEAGQPVTVDDILDIESVEATGHTIPDDAGFVFFTALGWERGLLYDFLPMHKGHVAEPRDIPKLLAGVFTQLLFRDRLTLSDAEWANLTTQRWFPFASLSHNLLGQMLNHARAGWSIDDLLPSIVEYVRGDLPVIRGYVRNNEVFARHRAVISQALDAYERREYEIVVQALLSRVEGVLREHTTLPKPKQADLAESIVASSARHPLSLMMPTRFRDYIEDTVFAYESFAVPSQVSRVTRHSVAHGVASDALFDEKAATLAVLIFQQLGYLFAKAGTTLPVGAGNAEETEESAAPIL